MKAFRQVAVLAAAAVIALACGGSGGGTSGGASSSSCSKTYKVGLVTDVGKLSDKSFNYDSWQGVLNAQKDSSLCVQARAIESSTQEDYPKNIAQFVDQKYDMIVTVGFKLGDATIAAAKAVGAHGLLIEVHPNPAEAKCDADQAQTFGDFRRIMNDLAGIPLPAAPL